MFRQGRKIFGAGLASAIGALALASGAGAATISVTTTADTFENGNGDGLCSVREAVETAVENTNRGGCGSQGAFTFLDDVVEIPAGLYVLTIPSDGDPNDNAGGSLGLEDQGVTLRGVGAGTATIDSNGSSVFTSGIVGGDLAGFENLTLTNSQPTGGSLIDLSSGGLRIKNSTLVGGKSNDVGGAVHTSGSFTIENSTFSNNVSRDGGGAIYLETSSGGTISNSTFTGNNADSDGDGGGGGGLVKENGAGELTLKNSILAGNFGAAGSADCAGTVEGGSHNLIADGTTFCDTTNPVSGPANLGPLADNGGKTPTHSLLAGSGAINAGSACLLTDQRGVDRGLGGVCDVGAYELVSCEGQPANRIGTPGDDNLAGTEGNDVFVLLGGNDVATGLGGNDIACGGDGNDNFAGGSGDDRFLGEAGNDGFTGDVGNDFTDGGDGDDTGDGGDGVDTLVGGDGNDNLKGAAGNDSLSGQAGKDKLSGGAGKDKLNGGPGKDKLKGNAGKDKCIGSGGKDTGKSCEKESSIP